MLIQLAQVELESYQGKFLYIYIFSVIDVHQIHHTKVMLMILSRGLVILCCLIFLLSTLWKYTEVSATIVYLSTMQTNYIK